MREKSTHSKLLNYLLLHCIFLIYALSAFLSKIASGRPFLSRGFILCYGGALLLLFLYAVAWQQMLKKLPLSIAYANKSIVTIWGMVIGAVFLGESVNALMVLGAGIIILGVLLMVRDND